MLASPYKFLDSYGVEDQELFYGREQEIKILLADIMVQRLVVLFAKTGTGKTSLINAGVRPILEERGYETFFVRVHRDPTRSARSAIEDRLQQPLPAAKSLSAQLRAIASSLNKPIVLFFDQFEEFFLYTVREDYRAARRFVLDMSELYHEESLVHIVLSMREEFFVELDLFRDDIPDIYHEDSNLRLRWFDESQATEAIVHPAQAVGVTIEPALVSALIRDLTKSGRVVFGTKRSRQIEPAQLQIVCDTLWRTKSGDRLTLRQYRALGSPKRGASIAQQILERRLQEEFEQLQTREQLKLLERLLPLLRTDRGTKRIWDLTSLRQALGDPDEAELRTLLERLGQSYLLRVSTREGSPVIELTHDYFVERLDELAAAARLLWPHRLLREALATNQTGHSGREPPLLNLENLVEVVDQIDDLELDRPEGELVLLSALANRMELRRIVEPVIEAGVDAWEVLRRQLDSAEGDEADYLLRALALLGTPEAFSLLESAMTRAPRAWQLLQGLARSGTPEALSVLELALERGWLAAHPISGLGFSETSRAVTFYAKALASDVLAAEAREALRSLARSQRSDVADAAEEALGSPPEEPAELAWPDSGIGEAGEAGGFDRSYNVDAPYLSHARTGELADHYRLIAYEILAGRVVPFLGAGANLCGRPEEVTWQPGQFDWLPSGSELSRYLAQMFKYRDKNEEDLVRVSQYVTLTVGAFPLYEELHRLFDGDYPPTRLHLFLAELPSIFRGHRPSAPPYQLIVTTNYDDVLERAFHHAREPFDVVTYDAEGQYQGKFTHRPHDSQPRTILEPNTYNQLTTDKQTVILKIHGAVDRVDETRDSYVITEDHYIDYLARTDVSKLFPVTLVRTLRRSHCLFLGYSLRDWNLRVILNRIWGDEKLRSKSWAIQRSPDRLDKELWNRRDVMLLDVPLEEYIGSLREALLEAPAGRR
jgi:hypothetical protein